MNPAEHSQQRKEIRNGLAEFYGDLRSHREVANIIQTHLVKSSDNRMIALKKPDLSNTRSILDLGCGFGYFTEGLKGTVYPPAQVTGIDVHAAYEPYFLKACKNAGLKGKFRSQGVKVIETFENRTFDLAISSYSLYFFPEFIPRISGLLKTGGHFVAITHAVPHMVELTSFIKEILLHEGIGFHDELPYESLIRNFSSENGMELLAPWFSQVKTQKCKSVLLFQHGEIENLMKYLRYKESFFLPGNDYNRLELMNVIAGRIGNEMKKKGSFSITKDDSVFLCSGPSCHK